MTGYLFGYQYEDFGIREGRALLSLPVEFCYELPMNRLLGHVLEFTVRLQLLAGDVLDPGE